MALSALSQSVFPISSKDKELGPSAPKSPLLNPVAKLGSNSAIPQVPKYIENDLQRILKAVLNTKLLVA